MSRKYGYIATIGADTSGLVAALKEVENANRALNSKAGALKEALKFDPKSIELLQQNFDLLSDRISNTETKLKALKEVEEDAKAARDKGDMSESQYAEYKRQIEAATAKLEIYQIQLATAKKRLDEQKNAQQENTKELQASEKAVGELGNSVEELGDKIDNAGQQTISFGDIFKANILSDAVMSGIRKLTDGFVDFAKNGIELASDLSEVQNVVDTTFGEQSDEINRWAESAKTSFGMSALAAKEYTGTLGAMLKSQGITSDSVVQLSTDLVGLAGDMASFYNLDVSTAFEKIRSGISGETEPLKQLGINMSVTNMEAYALAQGIETAWSEMSQQEQTMLRYNYLLEQTSDAQGDFAKTIDSYANQQRVMQLTMEELSAQLGEELLPIVLELTTTVSEKAPDIINIVSGIAGALANAASVLIEHNELVVSAVSAYGAFKGAIGISSIITKAVNAYKALTTATQVATIAQEANNAAAMANPYVLLIAGIAAAGAAIGSYVLQLDSAIEKQKDIEKAANETMASSEAEARTVEAKAERYKRLYEEYKKTGVATSEMTELAKELQELSPDTISLIDEEKGAYKELSASIEDVIKNIRLKGIEQAKSNSLDSYYNNITEYYSQQAEAYQEYSKAVAHISDETLAELEKGSAGAYGRLIDVINIGSDGIAFAEENGLDYSAFEAYTKAQINLQGTINETNGKIAEQERLISETSASYDKLAESMGAETTDEPSGNYWGDYYKKQSSETDAYMQKLSDDKQKQLAQDEEAVKAYEDTLQAKVDSLEKSLALRKISEDEYYKDLKQYLDENVNTESELYYKQLSNYEKYTAEKQNAAVKAAEEQQKAETEAAEKAENERINTIKKYWDKITKLNDRGEISDEDEYKLKTQLVEKYCDENEDTWNDYYDWLYDYTKNQEEKIAEEQVDAWKENSDKLADTLSDSYKSLVDKKKELKKSLLNIDLSETVTNSEGKEVNVLTDLDAEIKKIDRYNNTLERLKQKGASDSLIEQIQGMSYEDGSRQSFIDTLLSLSPDKLQLYFSDWERLQAKAEEVSQDQISDELDELNNQTADAVSSIFGEMPDAAYEDGAETAKSYLQGIIDNMGDLNDITTISSILGTNSQATTDTASGNAKSGKNSTNGQSEYISGKTQVVINLNDKQYIQTTLDDLIASGRCSGGKAFNI